MLMRIRRKLKGQEGQGMAEYALIIFVVALIAIVGFKLLGGGLSTKAQEINNQIKNT